MLRNTHLFLGGARSGKSALALSWANGFGPRRFFFATAEALDKEMSERIALHQAERAHSSSGLARWQVVEEPLDIDQTLKKLEGRADVVLLDCLTMWVSNQMFHQEQVYRNSCRAEQNSVRQDEGSRQADAALEADVPGSVEEWDTLTASVISKRVLAEFESFCAVLQNFDGAVALVSNELGLGLVPDNRLGRVFRDLAGKVNQMAAASCVNVTFVAAGLPLPLKRNGCTQALG